MAARHVYGIGPVRELVRARPDRIRKLLVEPGRVGRERAADPVAQLAIDARAAGVLVELAPRDWLDQLAGPDARHQGVLAEVGELEFVDPDDMVEAALAAGQRPLLLALDGVEDPRNLGAILRSAYLLGAHGVIIPANRAAGVTAVVSKASAGASELLAIAQVGNLARALDALKERGVWNVAIHASPEARPLAQIDLTSPACLVLGAEGSGVRPLVGRQCDFHAIIPMARTGVGSFNVSVAAAIALYEVARQRG